MSSLIYITDETQALVATDTLAVSDKGDPFAFTSKAFFISHLRIVIAGTGAKGFLDRWLVCLNGMIVRGIDHLNYHASRNLPAVWNGYKKDFIGLPENFTTTVYHFGFSEITGLIHSFAYRSTNGFRSEEIGYCIGIKPPCAITTDGLQFPHDTQKIMDQQRCEQMSLPRDERIYIGGEIHIHHLQKDGCAVYTLHRFEDYDRDEDAIYENFATKHRNPSTDV